MVGAIAIWAEARGIYEAPAVASSRVPDGLAREVRKADVAGVASVVFVASVVSVACVTGVVSVSPVVSVTDVVSVAFVT